MSVNLLCDPYKPARISDELESFFHFLVYLSVGYLRSNCSLYRNSWIKTYFVPSLFPPMYTGGGRKGTVIKEDARLTTFWSQESLLFNSPMDQLLGELIKSFAAHYKVMKHDLERASSPFPWSLPSSPGADKADDQGAATTQTKHFVPTPYYSDDSDCEEVIAEWTQYKAKDTTPTPEERELARRIVDHDFMLEFVAGLLRHEGWPDDDLIPVRPVPAADPRPDPPSKSELTPADAAPPRKRQRKAAPKEKTTCAPTQTARRPTAARQTRSQTRAASSKTRPGRK